VRGLFTQESKKVLKPYMRRGKTWKTQANVRTFLHASANVLWPYQFTYIPLKTGSCTITRERERETDGERDRDRERRSA
jgi:hypothetical protein